jgi:uncharacterized OB-fold protein
MSDATAAPVKPLPVPDEQSQPYWEATGRHELAIQRCQHCGQYAHPPVVLCEACLSTKPSFAFERVSGAGSIRTWTVMQMAFLPAFQADVPYVIAEVELAEQKGLTLLGRLVDGADAEIKLGMAVETVWNDMGPGIAVPEFKLATDAR